jgi:two-component system, OmpR family, sensor kinase
MAEDAAAGVVRRGRLGQLGFVGRWAARLVPRTLRGRLTLGLVTLLAVLFAVVGIVTTQLLGHFLVQRLDQQLQQSGARYAASLESAGRAQTDGHAGSTGPAGSTGSSGSTGSTGSAGYDEANPPNDTRAQASGTFGARLLAGTVTNAGVVDGDADDGQTTPAGLPVGTDDRVALTSSDRAVLAGLPDDGAGRSVRLSSLGEYRVVAVAGRDGDVLVTGLPLGHVEDTVHELAVAELVVFGLAVLVAAAAGGAWVRLALRPLDRVARAAERVSALSLGSGEVALDVRVPDDDPVSEVGRVGASLNRMLRHVEDALAQRHAVEGRLREFAADAGHELRTPVSTIRGHAELALRRPEAMPDEVRHALTRIEAESRRMGSVVDDLLLLARLDAGRPLEREEVDLTRLALDAVDDARAAAPGHRWRLDLPEEPVTVPGDAGRLAQAVGNLVANARIHTPAGTAVTVRLEVAEGSAGGSGAAARGERWERGSAGQGGAAAEALTAADPPTIRLSVADTGPGLDPDLAPRVFDRFVRGGKGRARASGSTGLGLAITRAVAEAHGGRVELSSEPGRTVFTLVLPR